MSTVVKFTSRIVGIDAAKENLVPDSTGYYNLTLGALNASSTSGAYYPLGPAKKLFEKSSILQRRICNGYLKGEAGHPKKLIGMSPYDYLGRVIRIEETNVSHHIKEVSLEELPNGIVAIKGLVRPSGPRGNSFKDSLENPDENTALSIRSLTKNYYDKSGSLVKELLTVVTWDLVTEPGIEIANKWSDLGLEDEFVITKEMVETLLEDELRYGNEAESTTLKNMLDFFIEGPSSPKKSIYHKW